MEHLEIRDFWAYCDGVDELEKASHDASTGDVEGGIQARR